MSITNIQLLRICKNSFGTALMCVIPFSHFPSLLFLFFSIYLFFCLKARDWRDSHLLLGYMVPSDSHELHCGSLKFSSYVSHDYLFSFLPDPLPFCSFPLTYPICNSDSLLPLNRAFKWIRLANDFCEVAFSNGVITQWCTDVVFALLAGKQRSGKKW